MTINPHRWKLQNAKQGFLTCLAFIVLSACQPAAPASIIPYATDSLFCGQWTVLEAFPFNCRATANQLTLSSDSQGSLSYQDILISFNGQIEIASHNDELAFEVQAGILILSYKHKTYTLQAGKRIEIKADQVIESPKPTPMPILKSTLPPPCTAPDDWLGIYTVKNGDSFYRIAAQFQIDMQSLIEANCLSSGHVLHAGETLQVPQTTDLSGQIVTLTPSALVFRADQSELKAGECTILRWRIDNVKTVRLNTESVSNIGQRDICPTLDENYLLEIEYLDGSQSNHQLSIIVRAE